MLELGPERLAQIRQLDELAAGLNLALSTSVGMRTFGPYLARRHTPRLQCRMFLSNR